MPTDQKTIDAYNKYAEKWAKIKRDGSSIYHVYLEKPAMYGKLPVLSGKYVLCMGCGSGEEVDYLYSAGASSVTGIDISSGLIEIAKKNFPGKDFRVMDMEQLEFPDESFDFAFASLSMHYLLDWKRTLSSLHSILKKGGVFLFSITHPLFSAVDRTEDEKVKLRILGYRDIVETGAWEIYGNYFETKTLDINLNYTFTAANCHRPLSLLVKDIIGSGFEILDIAEPRALDESKEEFKKFWEIHQRIPEFMIFEIKKR